LCVGIDAYPSPRDQLSGAVNDATNWAATLRSLGFEVTVLTNGDATRQAICDSLARMLDGASAGSVVAFQYAGHGTEVPDSYLAARDARDEDDGNDEALFPVDFRQVGVLLDDDLYRLVCEHLPDSVNLTGFYDCCHSGTGFRGGDPRGEAPEGARPRFVPFEPVMFGRANEAPPPVQRAALPPKTRQVLFSACRDKEVAYESGGSGHFTTHALTVVPTSGLTNKGFESAVIAAFNGDVRQHPGMQTLEPQAETRPFLGPLT
jgi:hypothetical protein